MNKTMLILTIVTLITVGCATSNKVDIIQRGDNKLSCAQLDNEFKKLEKSEEEIDSKKGVTGTNVAAAILWVPGLAYTYYDAGEATRLIAERKAHLTTIHNDNDCPNN